MSLIRLVYNELTLIFDEVGHFNITRVITKRSGVPLDRQVLLSCKTNLSVSRSPQGLRRPRFSFFCHTCQTARPVGQILPRRSESLTPLGGSREHLSVRLLTGCHYGQWRGELRGSAVPPCGGAPSVMWLIRGPLRPVNTLVFEPDPICCRLWKTRPRRPEFLRKTKRNQFDKIIHTGVAAALFYRRPSLKAADPSQIPSPRSTNSAIRRASGRWRRLVGRANSSTS